MIYFDYLRARRGLTIFASILGAFVLMLIVSMPFSHVAPHDVTVGVSSQALATHSYGGIARLHQLGQSTTFPFRLFCLVAVVLAVLFATGCATSVSRANSHLHFTFTKPVSRERLTLATIAVDALSIALAFCVALVLLLVPFAVVGLLDRIVFDPYAAYVVIFGLGVAFMWYGLIQAATTRMRGAAGVVLGLSWAVFITLASLDKLDARYVPEAIVALIHALNVINPFTYLKMLVEFGGVAAKDAAPYAGAFSESMAVTWLVAVLALALCVTIRKRMEV
jgi:hypothetical protein